MGAWRRVQRPAGPSLRQLSSWAGRRTWGLYIISHTICSRLSPCGSCCSCCSCCALGDAGALALAALGAWSLAGSSSRAVLRGAGARIGVRCAAGWLREGARWSGRCRGGPAYPKARRIADRMLPAFHSATPAATPAAASNAAGLLLSCMTSRCY
jgi:hypothetical protein